MNRILVVAALLSLVTIPLAAQVDAAPPSGPETEITGQVIDVSCQAMGVSGLSHKQCAQACAKAGVPLAILATDGNIYIPVSSKPGDAQNSRLIALVESRVKVRGIHRLANGLHTIEIKSVVAAR